MREISLQRPCTYPQNRGILYKMLLNIDVMLNKLTEYLEENYKAPETPSKASASEKKPSKKYESKSCLKKAAFDKPRKGKDLKDIVEEVGETFHELLFRKIEERGMSPSEVYHRANMDRKLFSKIRSNPAYHPSKSTVLDLAIALRLTEQETIDLLSRAEYAFSPSSKRDLIIRFFIEKGIYDQETINYALLEFGEDILGDQQSRRTNE